VAEPPLSFTFDGRPLQARAGSSIAAGLIENGITSWRLSRRDRRPRGVFGGIGTCFDCLVAVGEEPAVRACITMLADGDEILTSATVARP
jgi:predicted molibdopterin-dependent oxidoreductase YjgC